MTTDRRLVACPACRRLHTHPSLLRHHEPHYCSIGCYRAGHGLDDPVTGDGKQYCPNCTRMFDRDTKHVCPSQQGGDR